MKRRGRPCRYKPDGLRPSPSLSQPSTALVVVPAPGPEKRRGRLPRSGKMRQLASLARLVIWCPAAEMEHKKVKT